MNIWIKYEYNTISSLIRIRENFVKLGQKHTTASYYHRHFTNSVHRVKRVTGIPSKFDWRDRGVVGPVQNQESCGACWAFSTIGVAESMYAIKNGTLYPFSVQEVGRYIPDTLLCLQTRELLERARSLCKMQIFRKCLYIYMYNIVTRTNKFHHRINSSYISAAPSIFQPAICRLYVGN